MMKVASAVVALLVVSGWGLDARTASAEASMRYYPEAAQRAGVEGVAVISCAVTTEGRLTACTVVSETPAGYQFGEAALRMSPLFKMKPRPAVAGQAVKVPITFKLPR